MKGLAKFAAIAAVTAAVAFAFPANAQEFRDGIDSDASGALDIEEFVMAMGDREFRMHDTNGDDVMTAEEWLVEGGDFRQLTLDRFNTNGDDEMSADEIVEVFLWIFGNRDTNNDALLSPSEAPPFFIAE